VAGCSGGGSSITPGHAARGTDAKTTATLTIKWTDPTATAAVRRKDTISPAAQSIGVTVNGTPAALANRGTSPTQTLVIDAPVGTDQFIFSVYDQQNGSGNLIGTATVVQQIIDGTANTISAAIQAVCATTNVSIVTASNPFASATLSATGLYSLGVSKIVVAGKAMSTLTIEPEDADGDVIITGATGNRVPYSITGSATVTPIDGSHIGLTPLSGARQTTPDTLTVASLGCPATNVAVEHSPAIYVQARAPATGPASVGIYDWYGDLLSTQSITSGDVLIGYDTVSKKMITNTPSTGAINAYPVTLGTTKTPLFSIYPNSSAAWSNYLHSVFAEYEAGGYGLQAYTYANSTIVPIGAHLQYASTAIAADTLSTVPYGFTISLDTIYQYNLSTLALGQSSDTTGYPSALASDDLAGQVYAFNYSGGPPVLETFGETTLGSGFNTSLGFSTSQNLARGATDTDGDNIYAIADNGVLEASTAGGSALPGFNLPVGTTDAIVVVSTNEQ
jgi:hypothetical protein